MEYRIYRINHDNKDFMIENMFVDSAFQNVDTFIDDNKCIGFYVANEIDVLGYIYGYELTRFNSNPMLYIHSVDVNEKYRRIGVGTLMIDTMLQYAKEKDFKKVFLVTNKKNQNAVGLYQKAKGIKMNDDDIVFEWKKEDQ